MIPIEEASQGKLKWLLWLQVTVEDNTSELLYSPLLLLIPLCLLSLFEIIPIDAMIFGSAIIIAGLLLTARGIRNYLFLGNADAVVARIGPKGSTFRKWIEHEVQFSIHGTVHRVKHAFIKKEVSEGELVLVLCHRKRRSRILLVRRMADTEAAIG